MPFVLSARIDLIGAEKRAVDALHERRRAVGRIQALVGVRLAGEVRIGGDLPPGEVDRLQARLHHLHGLGAGHRTQSGHVLLGVKELPQPLGAEPRERVLDAEPTPDPLDVVLRERPLDPVPAPVDRPGTQLNASPSSELCAPECLIGS